MVHISQMTQSSSGWLGDGKIVYRGKQKPNTPFADNEDLQRLRESYRKEAQEKRRAAQAPKTAKTGHVTVYDASKRAYVSATPQEASVIRDVNKEIQAQRRTAQAAKTAKTGNVTVYDASKKAYVSATPQEAKLIKASNHKINIGQQLSQRTQLSPSVLDHNLGFDRPAKSAQESMGVFIKHDIEQALSKKTPLSPSVLDHNLGLDRSAKSAQESMGVFIKRDIEQALSKKTSLSPSVLDHNLGLDKTAKSAQESAAAFVEHGLTDTERAIGETTKKKGFWSSLGSGIKNLFTKAKNFFKTPKGKWALVGAAVIAAGTALWAYVSDRFSDKNKPNPTDGPSKVFMPKLNEPDENQKAEETDETDEAENKDEKTDTEKSDNDTTVVAPVPSDEADDVQKTEETENKDEKTDTEKSDNNTTVVAPVPADESEEAKETEQTDESKKSEETDNTPKTETSPKQETTVNDGIHKVVKGDNLWNIAKQDLINKNKDKSDYVPTNKEISDRTEELMKLNNKEYEKPLPEDSRKRVVIIEPDEKIKLK